MGYQFKPIVDFDLTTPENGAFEKLASQWTNLCEYKNSNNNINFIKNTTTLKCYPKSAELSTRKPQYFMCVKCIYKRTCVENFIWKIKRSYLDISLLFCVRRWDFLQAR